MTHGSRRIQLTDRPDPRVVARLGDEITAFNFATTGVHDGQEFYGAVHDDKGALVAGVYGWTWGGTGWIERLWVRESSRGQGLGTGLLAAVESEAKRVAAPNSRSRPTASRRPTSTVATASRSPAKSRNIPPATRTSLCAAG
jgi:GNAT superfamily N-acetyltransferase